METIVTQRLVLRPLHYTDAPVIQKGFNEDPSLTEGLMPIYKDPVHGAQRYIDITDEPNPELTRVVGFMICDKAQTPMGVIMFNASYEENAWFRNFWMFREYRGHGYMLEASTAATAWVLANKCYGKVKAVTAHNNKASLRIKEHQGFEITGFECDDEGHFRTIFTVTRETFIAAAGQ